MSTTSSNFNGYGMDLQRLRQVLRYDPDTGEFYWNIALSRRVKVGERAGTTGVNGYRYIRFDGYMILAHRLAWFYSYGVWPVEMIDHIDGNRENNRLTNLREATMSQNACNGALRSTNKSGYRGVSWEKRKQRWVARIVKHGKQHVLGLFKTPEDARDAYLKAAKELHGEFASDKN